METVALVTTAPLASFTVPEMRPPTPARAAKAKRKRAARSARVRRIARKRAQNIGLLVAIDYQLERECRLVVNGCQLEFCKNLVTSAARLWKFAGRGDGSAVRWSAPAPSAGA